MRLLKRMSVYALVSLAFITSCMMNVYATGTSDDVEEELSVDEDYGEVLGEIVDDPDSEYYGMEIIEIEEEEIPWGEPVLADESSHVSTSLANTGASIGAFVGIGTICMGLGYIINRKKKNGRQ